MYNRFIDWLLSRKTKNELINTNVAEELASSDSLVEYYAPHERNSDGYFLHDKYETCSMCNGKGVVFEIVTTEYCGIPEYFDYKKAARERKR